MSATKTLGSINDAAILADLQELDIDTVITGYATVLGIPTVTWATEPSTKDKNNVAAYFQQNNQLRQWT